MEEKINEAIKLFKERTEKDCYQINYTEGETGILDDKIGGKPYLPVGEEYPKDRSGNYMALLLQLNLKDIDLEGYPRKGILEIFVDKNVSFPCDYAVRYFEEGLEYQTDLPDVDVSEFIADTTYKITVEKAKSYMQFNDYMFYKTFMACVNEIMGTNITKVFELDQILEGDDWYEKMAQECPTPSIYIGGNINCTQNDPRDNLKGNHQEKTETLFVFDSYCDLKKFNIGDAGIIFGIISKEDIKNCNFQNALVDWDCC